MIIRELLQWKTSLNNDAEIRFKEYLWERTENKEDICGNKEQYLDELYNIKIEKYKKDLDEVLLGYLQFNNISTKSMWNAYKKINFMFSNKTKRHFIHKAICMQLYEKINFMKRMYPTIENYFKGEDIPRFLMMDIIEKVQKEFIKEKEDYYFKKFAYNISCELDQILSWTHKHRNLEELTKESEYSVRKQYGRGRILYDEE